jgi:hypothetical protein
MGSNSTVLRSKTPELVEQELWCVFQPIVDGVSG